MFRKYKIETLVQFQKFPWKLFSFLILVRVGDLFWVSSSYVPDEYWQSLEVAHHKVFGYGYLTWEWTEGIRSYAYVSLVSLIYLFLKYFHLDTAELVIFLPRVLQGLISALGDVYFIRWVHEKRSGQYSWALISWLTTYFISYCSTRTLINTFEMNLTTIALYYYPWSPKSQNVTFIAIVSSLCLIRPTSVIIWLPLILINISTSRNRLSLIFTRYAPIALIVAGLNVALDSYFHGRLVYTSWNFFKVNFLNGLSSFYGTHDIFWYFYVGLPGVLGLQIVPFYYKTLLRLWNFKHFWKSLSYDVEAQMILTVLWSTIVLSVVPHKEFRFLLPLLPMTLYISSGTLGRWSTKAKNVYLYFVGTLLIASSVSALIYLGRFHTVGPLETMTTLRKDLNTTEAKFLFLAPCHSFPLYSHLHADVPTRFLTCMPNLNNVSNYIDEADRYYSEPRTWLKNELGTLQPCAFPTHIIGYDSLNITNFLHSNNYTLSEKVFNSFIYPVRTGEFVYIYKRKGKLCRV